MPVDITKPLSDRDVKRLVTESARSEVRREAQIRVPQAFRTLDGVMKRRNKGASDGAKVSASKVVLEYADGKPTQQVQHLGDGQGLTIQILQLTTGQAEEIHVQGKPEEVPAKVAPHVEGEDEVW